MKTEFLALLGAVVCLTACQSRTVVYTSRPSAPVVRYTGGGTRTVTNTVYVDREVEHPTSLPGASRRIAEPGEPSNFPAETGQ